MKKRTKNKEKAERFVQTETGLWNGIRPVIFNESKFDKKKSRRQGKEVCRNEEY